METEHLIAVGLAGLALAAGAIAWLAYADPSLAAGAAAIATGAGAICAVGLLASRARWERWTLPPRIPDPRARLRDAFRSGALGRQAILAEIRGLEHAAGAIPGTVDSEAERQLLAAPTSVFLDWVEQHLAALERAT